MARFSKDNLVKDLRSRAAVIAQVHGFTDRSGTAQLRITPHCDKAKKVPYDTIDETVWYGRWKELLDLARMIEETGFGQGTQRDTP